MSTLKAFRSNNPAVNKSSDENSKNDALLLPWDALIDNVKNDFDVAHKIAESITTVSDRCQVTSFYVQAIIANSSIFLVSNTGASGQLNITHTGTCWLLGKSITCALPVGGGTVDHYHAVIRHTPEAGFFIADVGSCSGTRLNRRLLIPQKRQALRNGDMIELGDLVLEFFVDDFDRLNDPLDSHDITYTGYIPHTGMETYPGN